MKKVIAFVLLTALLFVMQMPVFAADAPPAVTAQGYIVIDATTGQVLLQNNATQAYYPASITKILTMALAYEKCAGDLSQQVTVSKEATQIPRGSSHVALLEGEVVSLQDVFNATLLMSANDGANVLAEYVAGSIPAFIDVMNAKMIELGLSGSHFANAHGYYDQNHYTTAYDMAKVTQYAYTIPGFSEFFGSYEYDMEPTNKQPARRFGTDNLMLVDSKYKYDGTIGGKSGWTQESGYTMVEVVEREGRRLICVVLASAQKYDKFKDSMALLDYCFANYRTVTLEGSAFESRKAPVYGGADKPLGEVLVNVPSVTVQLLNGMSQNDLQVEYAMPEKYIIGQPFNAVCTISLKDAHPLMGGTLAVVPMEIGSLGEILARNTGAFSPITTSLNGEKGANPFLIIIGGIFLAVLALVSGRIAYVTFLKAQRRKRKMERMRQMYLDANYGQPMTSKQARQETLSRRNAHLTRQKQPQTVQSSGLKVVIGGAPAQEQRRVVRR